MVSQAAIKNDFLEAAQCIEFAIRPQNKKLKQSFCIKKFEEKKLAVICHCGKSENIPALPNHQLEKW